MADHVAHDDHAAGIGVLVADGVALEDVVAHHGAAVLALAHVDAGVRVAAGVAVVHLARTGAEGVDPVQPVVGSSHVAGPPSDRPRLRVIAVAAGEQHAVDRVALHGEVLDRHLIGLDLEAVGELVLTIEDHLVAVLATDDQPVGVTVTAS